MISMPKAFVQGENLWIGLSFNKEDVMLVKIPYPSL